MTFHSVRSDSGGRISRFYAVSAKGDENGLHAAANVDLKHAHEHSNFVGGFPTNVTGDDPTELFKNHPAEIMGARADPSMTAHIPTLLGMAAERSMRDTGGQMPMHAKSLSPHSSRMIQGLRDRGINIPEHPDNPNAEVTNSLSFDDYNVFSQDPVGTTAPPAQVTSGRQLMRSLLRGSSVSDRQFGSERQREFVQMTDRDPRQQQFKKTFRDEHLPGMEPPQVDYDSILRRMSGR